MAPEMVFQSFAEAIDTAKANDFPIEAKFVLRGRIDYAFERGEISLSQLDNLIERIAPNFRNASDAAAEIASFGDSEHRQSPLIREPALAGSTA